jgi:hypothetical protein
MWGALSDERTVCHLPESQPAVVSLLSVCTICILHVIKRMYIYICLNVCIYNLHKTASVVYWSEFLATDPEVPGWTF